MSERRNLKTYAMAFLVLSLAGRSLAWHGAAASTERDGRIDQDLAVLVAEGLLQAPAQPLGQLTNLEVAGLTAEASRWLAQADTLPPPLDLAPPPMMGPAELPGLQPPAESAPPPGLMPAAPAPQAARSLQQLVEEFKAELSVLGIDTDKLEDRLADDRARREIFAALQKEYLKRTGTEVGGYTRGFMYNYRGFGNAAAYPPMDYNAAIFMEMDLKSIPIPSVLFDARIRFWRSIGMYYQDPIQPEYQLRWISLMNQNEVANLTFGDFFKSYTPLTLWNAGAPLYTLIDPTSFQRTRRDTEELVYMDQAPQWHMRGFQVAAGKDWPKEFFSGFGAQVMAGTLWDATEATFGSYYAGSQDTLSFAGDNLLLKGTGLLLWQDPNSANVPYLPDFPSSFAKQYQIGSIGSDITLPFSDKVDMKLSFENAYAKYNDDAMDPTRSFADSAFQAKGVFDVEGVHLSAKFLDTGSFFYSPGAQTNPYSAIPGIQGYLSSTQFGIDDALPGWLNSFVFQDVNRPAFAPYDRLNENFLPYGDATPDRQGLVLGASAELGTGGWFKPQFLWYMKDKDLGLHERRPEAILSDSGAATATGDTQTRLFSGYEAALTLNAATALGLKSKLVLQAENKRQDTDLQNGTGLSVDTWILAADWTVPFAFLKPVLWSAAMETTKSSGTEFMLFGQGNPTSLGRYPFYLDSAATNNNVTYVLQPMNLTRTTYAFGVMYPLSDKINFRFDYFLNDYKWPDVAGYDRYEHIGRFTYEARF